MKLNILKNIKFYKKIKLISSEYNINIRKKTKLPKVLHTKLSKHIKILKILGCLPFKKNFIINNKLFI